MELKFVASIDPHQRCMSSNRTFMELKLKKDMMTDMPRTGSNRTFMELKLVCLSSFSRKNPVLIVPLWN